MTAVGGAAAAVAAVTVVLVGGIAGVVAGPIGTAGAARTPAAPPGMTEAIPGPMLALYHQAAASCPGLAWSLVAAIGTVESANGTSTLPGVRSGANAAGAEGPMQFEPATFARYDQPTPPGGVVPPSPYDPVDAVWAAVRMLCADGAGGPGGSDAAVFAYDHSSAYVAEVTAVSQGLAGPAVAASPGAVPAYQGTGAVEWALAQLGTPYVWGGEAPGVGFDCSGLAQAAYAAVGVALPRVAQAQWDATTPVPAGVPLEPGDLVFFGAGPADVAHVGLYVGDSAGGAYMVDAPHTGAAVRVERFPAVVGTAWGAGEVYLGATRPGA